ncbi:hypothetical protein C8R45DRAFT_1217140 [Mycena sanguinolenta]|nr:hypothetical protein C8R45DRAFT_1217140 [Mycena sanguinolenta]
MFKLLLILPFLVSLTIAAPVGPNGLVERKLHHKGGASAAAVAAAPTAAAATAGSATPAAAAAAGAATQAAVAAASATPTDFANSVDTACTNLDQSADGFGNPDDPDADLNPCSFFTNPFPCSTDPDRATQLSLSLCPPGTPINVNPGTVGTVGNVAVTPAPGSTACTPLTADTASIAGLGDADLPPCATVAAPFQCTNDQERAAGLHLTPCPPGTQSTSCDQDKTQTNCKTLAVGTPPNTRRTWIPVFEASLPSPLLDPHIGQLAAPHLHSMVQRRRGTYRTTSNESYEDEHKTRPYSPATTQRARQTELGDRETLEVDQKQRKHTHEKDDLPPHPQVSLPTPDLAKSIQGRAHKSPSGTSLRPSANDSQLTWLMIYAG